MHGLPTAKCSGVAPWTDTLNAHFRTWLRICVLQRVGCASRQRSRGTSMKNPSTRHGFFWWPYRRRRYAKPLGSPVREGVLERVGERGDEGGIAAEVRHQPQLHLRVVRRQQHPPGRRHKRLPRHNTARNDCINPMCRQLATPCRHLMAICIKALVRPAPRTPP